VGDRLFPIHSCAFDPHDSFHCPEPGPACGQNGPAKMRALRDAFILTPIIGRDDINGLNSNHALSEGLAPLRFSIW